MCETVVQKVDNLPLVSWRDKDLKKTLVYFVTCVSWIAS